jgi:hypothetical protein
MPKPKTPYFTLVVAPTIPETERKALEKHYREALLDPAYTVILNYEAHVDLVQLPEGSQMIIVAPGIPVNELMKLRTKFEAARDAEAPEDRLVVCNYDVRVDVVNPKWLPA